MNVYLPGWLLSVYLWAFPVGWIAVGMMIRSLLSNDRLVLRLRAVAKWRGLRLKKRDAELMEKDALVSKLQRRVVSLAKMISEQGG